MDTESKNEIDFSRNSLDRALSPYLQSHADNPVHWQQWSPAAVQYASRHDLILLVSVGYSTCHWCHVMAADSFSDAQCADYLHRYFMPIKVDREERPDIDQYMMNFLVATTGTGGWPLNVFLSADMKPFFAMTYAAPYPKFGRPGFLDILYRIKKYYDEKKTLLQRVPMQVYESPKNHTGLPDGFDDENQLSVIDLAIRDRMDLENGGFVGEQKFPPHCTLLYALHRIADLTDYSSESAAPLSEVATLTLDVMLNRGLHDHLQGGFFRYCVDGKWTVPHFEKMLYDQAMLLWNYSLAAALFDNREYEQTAVGIVRCLHETFLHDGLFCAAHDADTGHAEGSTYLWTRGEIAGLLSADEFSVFESVFDLPEQGNFEGRIHLIRRAGHPAEPEPTEASEQSIQHNRLLAAAADRLLNARRLRAQPFTDRKKLTSWNALAGIGLLIASRSLTDREIASKARRTALAIRDALLDTHVRSDGSVVHGTIAGQALEGAFLEDHAALLLFLSYCYEEDRQHAGLIRALQSGIELFRDGETWIGANEADFMKVPAATFDSPSPSPFALALFASARALMVLGEDYPQVDFGPPITSDFLSVAALHTRGYVYTVQSPQPVAWNKLPVNTVQVAGSPEHYCIHGTCTPGRPVH